MFELMLGKCLEQFTISCLAMDWAVWWRVQGNGGEWWEEWRESGIRQQIRPVNESLFELKIYILYCIGRQLIRLLMLSVFLGSDMDSAMVERARRGSREYVPEYQFGVARRLLLVFTWLT